jgi:hypothetical protein
MNSRKLHLKQTIMNKILCISSLLIATACCMNAYPQGVPSYPIPSYNVSVNMYANFREDITYQPTDQLRGKRAVNVQVKSGSDADNCQATVWIYSLDRTTLLGPYTVPCGETLTVEIDEREWGAFVECEISVMVDVWFSEATLIMRPGNKQNPRK